MLKGSESARQYVLILSADQKDWRTTHNTILERFPGIDAKGKAFIMDVCEVL